MYGFEAEPFGKGSFRINGAISTLAQRGDVAGGFGEAVSAMRGTAPGMGREERILAAIACHSAVKLGDRLSHEEMEALIREWLGSRHPPTCPHGRLQKAVYHPIVTGVCSLTTGGTQPIGVSLGFVA